MTSYSAMAARGREESRGRTTGRRKRRAVDVRRTVLPPHYGNVLYLQRSTPPPPEYAYELIGECGHRLLWQILSTSPEPPRRLVDKVGRLVTCEHADCRIAPRPEVPDAERCEYVMGVEVERRCPTRSRCETDMGRACRKHRDHWLREGYINEDGSLRGD